MNCRWCGSEMNPVGMTFGNGWVCPHCKHERPEVASWKMTETGHRRLLDWFCPCEGCRSEAARHAMTEKWV